MINIKIISSNEVQNISTKSGQTLLDILQRSGFTIYAPCGGKGTCAKCRVHVKGKGIITSCQYYPEDNIEVILPKEEEAIIVVNQTEYLEDLPLNSEPLEHISKNPFGVAIDIGTTTVVLYFLNLVTGQVLKIVSLINPQTIYGGDVISRINYCQHHPDGLTEIKESIIRIINVELKRFRKEHNIKPSDFSKIIVVGNTTMLHFLLGEDPISIALAPFTPKFTDMQIRSGKSIGLDIHPDANVITLPCVSAYVGADIVSGITGIKDINKNILYIDIGTNGEMALITRETIYTCSTAAGPAFEGANISCGMGAVTGAISSFSSESDYEIIGNVPPNGICGSGIVDIIAYLLQNDFIDETGLMKNDFTIHKENKIVITQQDVREVQLAKSAIYSGLKILLDKADKSFDDIDFLYLAGGFGNYINHKSAIQIGLLPEELDDKIKAVGNSAGIGALQYLKSIDFERKTEMVLNKSIYIELSNLDEFNLEFALNMNFTKQII
jgi:uncharacterized 2Fe-2S/4Fe-4S cluster protein (DUF4445 family)